MCLFFCLQIFMTSFLAKVVTNPLFSFQLFYFLQYLFQFCFQCGNSVICLFVLFRQTFYFDPYRRSQVMAGVGYYRGKEAVALGLAHYKNEDLMFHGGLAYAGSSELMANIGVTYRFGSKDDRDIKHERNLRMPQYAEGPISSVYMLQDEVERLSKRINNASI